MKKRILVPVVLALLMSVCMLTCFAADVDIDADTLYDIEFYVEESIADYGDTSIDVGIDVKRNPGLAAVNYELVYNDVIFTLTKQPEPGEIPDIEIDASSEITASPHFAVLSEKSGNSIYGNGRLVTYTFAISPEAEAGTYPVEIRLSGNGANGTELKVLDEDYVSITPVIYNGSITIPGYTVSFDANGGEGEVDAVVKTHGKDAVLPNTKPEKYGYEFVGWSTDKTAQTAMFEAGSAFNIDGDTVLYAVWKLSPDTVELTLSAGKVQEVETAEGSGVFEKRVVVTINATQNPGFNALVFYLDYDKTRLEYIPSFAAYPGTGFLEQEAATDNDKFQLIKVSNYSLTGPVATLTFKVLDEAPLGDAFVNIVPVKDECIYDNGSGLAKRNMAVNSTAVAIGPDQLLGDINLDGTVDINDAIYLFQFSMMGEEYYPINYNGSVDYVKDGNVDINDAIYLFQYSMMGEEFYPIEW